MYLYLNLDLLLNINNYLFPLYYYVTFIRGRFPITAFLIYCSSTDRMLMTTFSFEKLILLIDINLKIKWYYMEDNSCWISSLNIDKKKISFNGTEYDRFYPSKSKLGFKPNINEDGLNFLKYDIISRFKYSTTGNCIPPICEFDKKFLIN